MQPLNSKAKRNYNFLNKYFCNGLNILSLMFAYFAVVSAVFSHFKRKFNIQGYLIFTVGGNFRIVGLQLVEILN